MTEGTGVGEWHLPHKLAVDAQENLYIIDRENKRLQVFDKDLNYIREIKNEWNPWDIGISRKGTDGFAYIADHLLERVHKMQLSDGKLVATWGSQGLGPGQFDWVHGVVVDSQGKPAADGIFSVLPLVENPYDRDYDHSRVGDETDAAGRFSVGLSAGRHRIRGYGGDGFQSETQEIEVREGEETDVRLVVDRRPAR